jgi:hypothetical protein
MPRLQRTIASPPRVSPSHYDQVYRAGHLAGRAAVRAEVPTAGPALEDHQPCSGTFGERAAGRGKRRLPVAGSFDEEQRDRVKKMRRSKPKTPLLSTGLPDEPVKSLMTQHLSKLSRQVTEKTRFRYISRGPKRGEDGADAQFLVVGGSVRRAKRRACGPGFRDEGEQPESPVVSYFRRRISVRSVRSSVASVLKAFNTESTEEGTEDGRASYVEIRTHRIAR